MADKIFYFRNRTWQLLPTDWTNGNEFLKIKDSGNINNLKVGEAKTLVDAVNLAYSSGETKPDLTKVNSISGQGNSGEFGVNVLSIGNLLKTSRPPLPDNDIIISADDKGLNSMILDPTKGISFNTNADVQISPSRATLTNRSIMTKDDVDSEIDGLISDAKLLKDKTLPIGKMQWTQVNGMNWKGLDNNNILSVVSSPTGNVANMQGMWQYNNFEIVDKNWFANISDNRQITMTTNNASTLQFGLPSTTKYRQRKSKLQAKNRFGNFISSFGWGYLNSKFEIHMTDDAVSSYETSLFNLGTLYKQLQFNDKQFKVTKDEVNYGYFKVDLNQEVSPNEGNILENKTNGLYVNPFKDYLIDDPFTWEFKCNSTSPEPTHSTVLQVKEGLTPDITELYLLSKEVSSGKEKILLEINPAQDEIYYTGGKSGSGALGTQDDLKNLKDDLTKSLALTNNYLFANKTFNWQFTNQSTNPDLKFNWDGTGDNSIYTISSIDNKKTVSLLNMVAGEKSYVTYDGDKSLDDSLATQGDLKNWNFDTVNYNVDKMSFQLQGSELFYIGYNADKKKELVIDEASFLMYKTSGYENSEVANLDYVNKKTSQITIKTNNPLSINDNTLSLNIDPDTMRLSKDNKLIPTGIYSYGDPDGVFTAEQGLQLQQQFDTVLDKVNKLGDATDYISDQNLKKGSAYWAYDGYKAHGFFKDEIICGDAVSAVADYFEKHIKILYELSGLDYSGEHPFKALEKNNGIN